MKTLDQYRAAEVSKGPLSAFEAAHRFKALNTSIEPTVSDEEAPLKTLDPNFPGTDFKPDKTIRFDADGAVQIGSDFENPEIDNDTSRLIDPDTGKALDYRATKSAGDEYDKSYVSKLKTLGHESTARLLEGYMKKSTEDPSIIMKGLSYTTGVPWDQQKKDAAATVADVQYLIDQGRIDQAHMRLTPGKDALVPVTSPAEFYGGGLLAAAKIGGKTAAKVFTLGAPAEYAGTMVAEEVAEDNVIVGLAGMVASGLMVGAATNRFVNLMDDLGKWHGPTIYGPIDGVPTEQGPSLGTPFVGKARPTEGTGFNAPAETRSPDAPLMTLEPSVASGPPDMPEPPMPGGGPGAFIRPAPIKLRATPTAPPTPELPVAPGPVVPPEIQPVALALRASTKPAELPTTKSALGAKQSEVAEVEFLHNYAIGNVLHPEVRSVYSMIVDDLSSANLPTSSAGIARVLELKLQGTQEPKLGDYTPQAAAQLAKPKTIVRKGDANKPESTVSQVTDQIKTEGVPASTVAETTREIQQAPSDPIQPTGQAPEMTPVDQIPDDIGSPVPAEAQAKTYSAVDGATFEMSMGPVNPQAKEGLPAVGGAEDLAMEKELANLEYNSRNLPAVAELKPDFSPFSEPRALNADERARIEADLKLEWFGKPTFKTSMDDAAKQRVPALLKEFPGLTPDEAKILAVKELQTEISKGLHGDRFKTDVNDLFNSMLAEAKAASKATKKPVVMADIRKTAHDIVLQEYNDAYDTALAKRLAEVRPLSMIKMTYLEGLSGRAWDDMQIEAKLVFHPTLGAITYDPSRAPSIKTGKPFKSTNFDYTKLKSRADAEHAMKQFINYWEHARTWEKPYVKGQKNKKVLPGADKVRGKSWWYDTKALQVQVDDSPLPLSIGRTKENEGLTDDAYIRVAKMYGWAEEMLPPTQSFDAAGKQTSYTATEDIIAGYNAFKEFELSLPGNPKSEDPRKRLSWLRSVADQQAEQVEDYLKEIAATGAKPSRARIEAILGENTPDPRYYKAVFGRKNYMAGVKDFLRQQFGLPVDAEPWELTNRVEELAVMQQRLANDIIAAEGTPQENTAKKLYLLFQDTITGSANLDYARTVNQATLRKVGYDEVIRFQADRVSETDHARALAIDQDAQGMTGKATPLSRLEDDIVDTSEELDEFGQVIEKDVMDAPKAGFDEDGIGPVNDDVDNAGFDDTSLARVPEEADAYEAGLTVQPTQWEDQFKEYTDARRIAYAKQVNQIENKFGVRFIEPEYEPAALGGSGKFNLFKINNAADLMLSLGPLDDAFKAVPVVVDPVSKFGLTPKPGLPQLQVSKLSTALTDAQLQIDSIVDGMIKDPNNVLQTIAFEKMRAIHQTLVDALTIDDISLSAPVLDKYNFMALDDIQMAENFGKHIMENFIIHSKIGPDTRLSTTWAQMYSTLPTARQKAQFLTKLNTVHTNNPPLAVKESIKLRQELSTMIEDACGRH